MGSHFVNRISICISRLECRSNVARMSLKCRSYVAQMSLSVPHFTKYLLSYIGCHGYILYLNVTKLWDHDGNPLYISTTKFGNPNLMEWYFLSAPKIAENRKISKVHIIWNLLLLHKYLNDVGISQKMIFWYFIILIEFYKMLLPR